MSMMKKKNRILATTLAGVILVSILTLALIPQAKPAQAAPLYATALLEGRTYDQAHNTGFIDWSGSVQYANLYHRSQTVMSSDEGGHSCTSGCTEPITRISSGSSIRGSFLRDVTYFEAMAAFKWSGTGVGILRVEACGAVLTHDLRKSNNTTPGFNSFALTVPAGCRAWTVSASSGHVDIRSVDANYVTPTPTPTATFTSTPTNTPTMTYTPTMTPTGTPPPTATFTNTPTMTFTPTATSTGTPPPTATFTNTPTMTFTPTTTSTGTLSPTSTPTMTPSPTATEKPAGTPWVVTVPVVIVIQEQNVTTGGGGTLSEYAVSPTPPVSSVYGVGGTGCNYALRTFAYVDENDDKLMSPAEGAEGLEIVFMNASYDRLGNRYTKDGQAVFCLNPSVYGKTVRVEIPYLHQAQDVNIPGNLGEDVEVWFPLEPPTLPLFLP